MNKRLVRLLIFLFVLFAADRIVGLALKSLYSNSNAPDIAKIRYTLNFTNQNILIFGSSRAQHHYIPDTIVKYTQHSVYNCGIGGQGLAFSYIQIHETLKRYTPKLIILDLSPNILFDSFSEQKLNILSPYHSNDSIISNILMKGSLIEKLKFTSGIYSYNGTIFNILYAYLHYRPNTRKGYIPLFGTIDPTKFIEEKYTDEQRFKLPKKQIYYLNKIIDICKTQKVKLFFVVSPIYKPSEEEKQMIDQLTNLSQKDTIEIIDYSIDINFINKRELFKDNLHLNNVGAKFSPDLLSKSLIQIIEIKYQRWHGFVIRIVC